MLQAWLWAAGTEGLSSTSLPGGDVIVTATFCEERQLGKKNLADLMALSPGLVVLDSGPVDDRDWLAAWRAAATPILLGEKLLVDPRESEPTAPAVEGRFVLRIPARTAFGVGSHESTRLAYELLEATDLRGKRVLDVGCGSGILAMAALLLGAREAIGFDLDPTAALLAGQYARMNDVAPRLFVGTVEVLRRSARGSGSFDIIVLNVLPHEIVDQLEQVLAQLAPQGELLVSGILASESTTVESFLERLDCKKLGQIAAGEWVGQRFLRRSGEAKAYP